MITQTQLDEWFCSHPVLPGQQERYQAVRDAAKRLAAVIASVTPPSADQTAALRKVREAVMTANAGIACESPEWTEQLRGGARCLRCFDSHNFCEELRRGAHGPGERPKCCELCTHFES